MLIRSHVISLLLSEEPSLLQAHRFFCHKVSNYDTCTTTDTSLTVHEDSATYINRFLNEFITTNKFCLKVVVFIIIQAEVEILQHAFSLIVVRDLTSGVQHMCDFFICENYPLLCCEFRTQKQARQDLSGVLRRHMTVLTN